MIYWNKWWTDTEMFVRVILLVQKKNGDCFLVSMLTANISAMMCVTLNNLICLFFWHSPLLWSLLQNVTTEHHFYNSPFQHLFADTNGNVYSGYFPINPILSAWNVPALKSHLKHVLTVHNLSLSLNLEAKHKTKCILRSHHWVAQWATKHIGQRTRAGL